MNKRVYASEFDKSDDMENFLTHVDMLHKKMMPLKRDLELIEDEASLYKKKVDNIIRNELDVDELDVDDLTALHKYDFDEERREFYIEFVPKGEVIDELKKSMPSNLSDLLDALGN